MVWGMRTESKSEQAVDVRSALISGHASIAEAAGSFP
jgi:hypothetical protein